MSPRHCHYICGHCTCTSGEIQACHLKSMSQLTTMLQPSSYNVHNPHTSYLPPTTTVNSQDVRFALPGVNYLHVPSGSKAEVPVTLLSHKGFAESWPEGGMDGDERRRKQYGPPAYHISSPTGTHSGQRVSYQPSESYQQTLPSSTRAESSRSSISRPAGVTSYGAYAYPEQQAYNTQAVQGGLQYSAGVAQDASRQQQSQQISPQQYPQYVGPVVYNLGQASQSHPTYAPTPTYEDQARVATEVLSNQFSLQQYYVTAEPTTTGLPAVQTHYVASQTETPRYPHQSPISRPTIPQSYDIEMDYSPMGTAHPPPQPTLQSSDSMEDAFQRYQQQVDVMFQAVIAGRLAEASEEILNISAWLLGNVTKLGEHPF